MSIETQRRPIPFGEQMPEKYCLLMGHIGQIGVMRELGRMLDDGGKLPGSSAELAVIRELCTSLHRGSFADVVQKVNAHSVKDNGYLGVAYRLGMTHESRSLKRHILSGTAMAAIRFAAGQTQLAIPSEYQSPFDKLVTFYADRTVEEITLSATVSKNGGAMASEPIRRSGGDIAYEVKYLEPALGNGFADSVESR